MDSKPELKVTALQRSQIDKMVEMAGELLFEAHAGRLWARAGIKELSHHLGRLYGETIRACKEHEGLRQEVVNAFMSGMALEPNFGREEEEKEKEAKDAAARALYLERFPEHAKMQEEKAEADGLTHWHVKTSGATGTKAAAVLDTALREGTLGEAKSLGQLLYEGQPHGAARRPWAKLPDNSRRAFEKEAAIRAEGKKQRDARMANALSCWKCHGTKDMGFTTPVPCDACE